MQLHYENVRVRLEASIDQVLVNCFYITAIIKASSQQAVTWLYLSY